MSQIRCRSKKRIWLALAIAGYAVSCATGVHAAVLGAGAGRATIGQPLDFLVAARLDASEALATECVSAEVQVGDRHLPPSQVHIAVESAGAGSAHIRIQTQVAVDEPIVSLIVAAACGNSVSKQYFVLVDPPELTSRAAAAVPLVSTVTVGTVLPAAVDSAAAVRPGVASSPPGRPVTARTPNLAAAGLPRSAWRAVALRQPVAAPTARGARHARPASPGKGLIAAARPRPTPQKSRRLALAVPRLQLDSAEPLLNTGGGPVEQALMAVAQAAAAAGQAASAASAAADRIASLERTVDQLRGEVQSARGQAAVLRDQLARVGSPTSTWLLGGVVLVLGLLAGWLSMRLWATRRAPFFDGKDTGLASPLDSAGPAVEQRSPAAAPDHADAPLGAARVRPAPAWPPPAPPDGWLASQPSAPEASRLGPAPAGNVASLAPSKPASVALAGNAQVSTAADLPTTPITNGLSRSDAEGDGESHDVSIDELLDVEQQAEFFVVLGQDEAAIDLLVEHLRHTGGGSPLPYLKLLEIHRRRGSRSDYERMRARFNHRFNAYAPEWEADLQSGQSLDAYAGALSRLERAWPRPPDSMAVLEAMLFRKADGDLFDLPAYREVLFLYALARDLLDRESAETGEIDVLLPLSAEAEFSCTAPTPFTDLRRDVPGDASSRKGRSTEPVDFDLSLDGGRPTSIFDPLQEAPLHTHNR
jgi:hypothetical protein